MNFFKKLLLIACTFSTVIIADPIGKHTAALSLLLQSNGRPVVAGWVDDCDLNQIMVARYLADGTLDGTWNGIGSSNTIFGGDAAANGVAIQSADSKIVVAGYSDDTIAVARFTTAGVLDTSFGSGGRFNFNLGIGEVATAVAMQSTKPLIAGYATVAGATQFVLARLTAAGALDVGFGTSGITTTPILDGASANAMGQQSTGKIILAGTAVNSGTPVFAIARYSSSGVLDTTFGSSGITTVSFGSSAVATALAIDSSNKIVLVGNTILSGTNQIAVARLSSSGTLDGSFGTSGKVTIDISGTDVDEAWGVAIQADGKIVIAGSAGTDILVIRLETDGSLDTSFGGGAGYVTTTIGDVSVAHAVAIQPADQMIVVAGSSDDSVALLRYDVDGNLDTSFGTLGTGWVLDPSGSPAVTCGTCTVCPTGATGPTGIASLGSYAYFYNTSLNLLLNTTNPVPVPFNAEGVKNNITHSTVTNSDQITIDTAGTYKVTAAIDLSTTQSGVTFALYQNSSPVAGTSFALSSSGTTVVQAIINASASDIIQLMQTGLMNFTIVGNVSITIEQIA